MDKPSLTTAPLTVADNSTPAEFATVANACRLFGVGKSWLYEEERAKNIRFVRLRTRGQLRGRTLVDLDSVRRLLARCAEEAEPFAFPKRKTA